MIDLKYSLVIKATKDLAFFGFYSPELKGFTGVGHSIENCLYKAKWGMEEHIALMYEQNFPFRPPIRTPLSSCKTIGQLPQQHSNRNWHRN